MYSFQFLLIHFFFPATRRKPKLFQIASRSSYYRSYPLQRQARRHVCGERGGWSLWAVHSGDTQVSSAAQSTHPPAAHTSGVETGSRQVQLCLWHPYGHNQRRGSPYSHHSPGLPNPAVLSSQHAWSGNGITSAASQSCCFPFLHIPTNPKQSNLRFLQELWWG